MLPAWIAPCVALRPVQASARRLFASMASAPTQPHRALLLLPPVRELPSYAALKAAYHQPLLTTLRELAQPSCRAQEPALLEVALPCSHLYGRLNASRGPLYPTTQQLVADLYKLICVSAAQESIETDGPGGVDARLVLVAYPQNGQLPEAPAVSATRQELEGLAIDLYTLARHRTPWDTVYSTQCEQGETILNQYLSVSKPPKRISRIPGSPPSIDNTESSNATSEAPVDSVNHLSVAVGGTFDHLHIGHKLLLTMFAFTIGRSGTGSTNSSRILTVVITGDSMLKNKKYADQLESWKCRQASVQRFLSSLVYYGLDDDDGDVDVKEINEPGPNGHALHVRYPSGLVIRYVEIWDPFGPTITDKDISALVLSLETRGGGAAVNDKRKEQGWDALEVFEVAVLDASEEGSVDETFQSKLSSTEIRRKRSEREREQ